MPSGTTSKMFFWLYVLESRNDEKRYVGYTNDINKRLKEHEDGKVVSTEPRRPFKLIYLEGCTNQKDAMRREKYMKTTDGRRFLSKRLKCYYSGIN
jgi:putative endonuclease